MKRVDFQLPPLMTPVQRGWWKAAARMVLSAVAQNGQALRFAGRWQAEKEVVQVLGEMGTVEENEMARYLEKVS